MTPSLDGVTILVVEDEFLIASLIQQILENAGCTVCGPIPRPEEAISAVDHGCCDAAVLDINLGGERCFAVAERLRQLRVPFVFVTGYRAETLPPEFGGCPILQKPFRNDDLLRVVGSLLGRSPRRSEGDCVPAHG